MYNPLQASDRRLKKDKEKLENQKQVLESKDEIRTFLAWLTLPSEEKNRNRKKWNDYYEKSKNTKACKEFFKMRDYFKSRNMKKFEELRLRARKRLENQDYELTKPEGVDPWDYSFGIYEMYQQICLRIKYINKRLTGVEDPSEIFTPKPARKAAIKVKQYKQPYME